MADDKTEQLVTSDPVARTKRGIALPRRSVFAIALSTIVLLAVASGLWAHFNTTTSQKISPITESPQIMVTRLADDRAANGDYAGAQSELDHSIGLATSNKDKGALYESKGLLAYNYQKYQDGLNFAQKAELLQPTSNSAYVIAVNAESLGNKALALDNYKKALGRIPQITRDHAPDITDMYTQKIQELSK